ncbi:MAG TPA: hypothetical protein VGN72_13555 [Tepidisphaeraceae bacterium]|jgi:hypothetical protein|nr:hypothetical protein [Tepidisphaeraceae bacterium]
MSVGGAVAVALVVGMGRFAFTGSAAPAAATASLSRPMTVLEPQATRMLARRPLSDQASPAVQEWVRTPIAPVGRNLFAIKLDYFPQDGTKVDQTLRAPQGNGFWDKLAKSMASRADQRRERQILVENLQLQAMQLRLQSTVMGPSPGALVNGSLVREGDVVASFRVLKIEARRIVVEREGIKLEIPMQ